MPQGLVFCNKLWEGIIYLLCSLCDTIVQCNTYIMSVFCSVVGSPYGHQLVGDLCC